MQGQGGADLPQWQDWRAIMAASFLDVSVDAERPGLIAIVDEEIEQAGTHWACGLTATPSSAYHSGMRHAGAGKAGPE